MEVLGSDVDDQERIADQTNDGGPLDDNLVVQMEDFLIDNGGSCELGKFANKFPRIKKKQLEPHFEVFGHATDARISLLPDHPGRQQPASGSGATVEDDTDPNLEPQIPPKDGAMPTGFIRDYSAEKGFGFIKVNGMKQDIFFPREALPKAFQLRKSQDMPNLNGVHVSFDEPKRRPD